MSIEFLAGLRLSFFVSFRVCSWFQFLEPGRLEPLNHTKGHEYIDTGIHLTGMKGMKGMIQEIPFTPFIPVEILPVGLIREFCCFIATVVLQTSSSFTPYFI